jgi:DNA-binding NarL/FixJ family response regulator
MAEIQKRVLVVDSPSIANPLASIFVKSGYEVRAEYSSEAALASDWQPDLAVIEMFILSERCLMNGADCADQLRVRYPGCRFILLYASAADELIERCRRLGYELFQIPVAPEMLLRTAATLLRGSVAFRLWTRS